MTDELPRERLFTAEEMELWMEAVSWKEAKNPDNPHSYTLKRNTDPHLFDLAYLTLREYGERWQFMSFENTLCRAGDYMLFELGGPLECVVLMNRKTIAQHEADIRRGRSRRIDTPPELENEAPVVETATPEPVHERTNMDRDSLEHVSRVCERILEILRQARPELSGRIDRAESLLVTQLSVSNGVRPIKARLRADGSRAYLVRSGSRLNRTYTVEPESWSCNCPWQAQGGTACKHALGCWVLEQIPRQAPKRRQCIGCGLYYPPSEIVEVEEDNRHLMYFQGEALCQSCAKASS